MKSGDAVTGQLKLFEGPYQIILTAAGRFSGDRLSFRKRIAEHVSGRLPKPYQSGTSTVSAIRPGQPPLCGHFRRIRYGEGLAESRLGWIQPVLVNASELTGAGSSAVKTKPYVVR